MATSVTEALSRAASGGQGSILSCRRTPNVLMPNCLIGYPWSSNWLPPAIAIGANVDFCMEFWHANMGAYPAQDNDTWVGAVAETGGDLYHMYMVRMFAQIAARTSRSYFDRDGAAGGTTDEEAGAMGYGWTYYAVNWDRDGDMEIFTDTVSGGTDDISPFAAVNLGNQRFWPSTTGDELGVDELDSQDEFRFAGAVGPFAMHLGTLLTDAQMASSWTNRYVQNLTQTQVLYDWREVLGLTDWEYDTDNICLGCHVQGTDADSAENISIPFAAPIGPGGGVTVRDLSGNGNDLPIPTATSYGTTTLGATNPPPLPTAGTHQAICTFGSSTFFV